MPIAQDMKNITEGIEISYGERMSWLSEFRKDTHQMMRRIDGENKEAAEASGVFLDENESTRISNFKKMLSAIRARQRERNEEVASLIRKFEDELSEMAAELKGFLGRSESIRLAGFKKMLAGFKKMLAEIKGKQRAKEEEVARLITAFRKDMNEARGHWQNMAKILAAKKAGKRIPIAEVPKEAHVPKKVEKAAEEAFGEGDLKARTWSTVEANPQGISLRQIGKELKLPYIRLAKSMRELVRESKVAKRDSQYFPA